MNNLRILRKNLNKTQAQIAEGLNIKRATYARYENNETEPDFETLQKMAEYFNCSIDYIIGKGNGHDKSKIKNDLINTIQSLTDEECDRVLAFIKGMRSI